MDAWWYVKNGKRLGPVSEEELHGLLIDGSLTANSLVWKKGMERWEAAGQIDGFAAVLASLPPELPAAPPRVWINEETSVALWSWVTIAFWLCVTVFVVLGLFILNLGSSESPIVYGIIAAALYGAIGLGAALLFRSGVKKAFWICFVVYLVGVAFILMLKANTESYTTASVTLDNLRSYLDFVGLAAMISGAMLLWRRFKAPLARMLQLS
jgi:hypothetical protein